ncbi:unnamed protein product, partial [marine sediment metagenome]
EFENRSKKDKEDYTEEQFEDWCKDGFKTSNVNYRDYCEDCDISEDSCEPMMNYAYPLHHEPTEEEILRVVKETSLTIIENQDTGDWFLGLCGGGMDLSQSIGYAYLICGYIPDALAFNVSSQYGLNISGKKYFELMNKVIDSLQNSQEAYKNKIKRIKEAVKEAKEKQKQKE